MRSTSVGEPPLDHVRRPDLPWRASTLTECGQQVNSVKACINRDELIARISRDGQRRTAYSVCMTCLETSRRWSTFDQDPVSAMTREVYNGRHEPGLADELRALAALAQHHRDEFDQFIDDLRHTVSLGARRRASRQRARGGGAGA